ncbi:MAG: pseudoazurin [Gammaproteobacteria bacterium]|jgi:pseudoazurin
MLDAQVTSHVCKLKFRDVVEFGDFIKLLLGLNLKSKTIKLEKLESIFSILYLKVVDPLEKTQMKIIKIVLKFAAMSVLLVSFNAIAEEHVIAAGATNFNPIHLFVKPGDTVKWTNMTIHDTQSMDGLIPEGAEPWQSKIGQELAITVEKEGVYIYKCNPHFPNGMVGAIIVGEASNMNQIEANAKGREKGIIFKLKKILATQQ